MKLKSTYNFFKAYFSYATTGKVNYAIAISDTMEVVRDVLAQKNLSPMQIYLHKPYSREIAKGMLKRLVPLAMSLYKDPFNEIQYLNIIACIDKKFISTNHKGIDIPLECGCDKKNNKLIFLTFGPPNNMREEVRVIKALIKEFVIAGATPTNIRTVAYWDLSKGKITEIDYQSLQPVDRQSLIEAANRI